MSIPGQLRAPRQDGAIVAEPPLTKVGELLARNRQRLAQGAGDLLGRPWSDLRRQARQDAVAGAQDYFRRSGEPLPSALSSQHAAISILMAGHQPDLFHPGVWIKNFALNGLARKHGAIPVNLLVDNDSVKATSLHVPLAMAGPPPISEFQPQAVTIPFDHWTYEVPYEERLVQDESLFDTFAERAHSLAMERWGFRAMLKTYWEEVRRQGQRTRLLGERLAAARRVWERRWGCHNLEVPVSALCRTEPFAWFACHLLAGLPRFHAVYNECVHDYRRRYGIRSRNHPVPDLAAEAGWLEAPFWGWRAGQTRRGRLFARTTEAGLQLRVAGSVSPGHPDEHWPSLPLDTQKMVAAWLELERLGFKVRSRALTNTLYARLFLADLFVHGIGGAKYDELTDEIIRRYYGFEPPAYMVLSATLLLPFTCYPAQPEERRRLAWELRDLHYNPQRHLGNNALADPSVRELVRQRLAWIERRPANQRERRERFQVLRSLNERLHSEVADHRLSLRQELDRCDRELEANVLLQRRDYAFCLYPETRLRAFCTAFLG